MSFRKHLKFSLAEMFVLLAVISVVVALNCVERTGEFSIKKSGRYDLVLRYQYYGYPFQMIPVINPIGYSEPPHFSTQGVIGNILALLFVLVVTLMAFRYSKRLTSGKRETLDTSFGEEIE